MPAAVITPGDIQMSAAYVTFKSVDLGAITGGVTFNYTVTTQTVFVDQLSMPVKEFVTQETCQAVLNLSEYNLTKLQYAFSTGNYVLDAGAVKKKIEVGGGVVDQSNDYGELVITYISDGSATIGTDANLKITIYKALCVSNIDLKFEKTAVRVIPVTFKGYYDSTKAAGKQLFLLGDSTAT